MLVAIMTCSTVTRDAKAVAAQRCYATSHCRKWTILGTLRSLLLLCTLALQLLPQNVLDLHF